MREIRCLKDFESVASKINDKFLVYLKQEFYGLYEYLSNGEKIEDFLLIPYESMIILEDKEELDKVIENKMGLEFIEKLHLNNKVVLRIGIRSFEDIQLHYSISECKKQRGKYLG
ncbi:hypothetical protein BSP4_43400 [Bacillus subtilis subsp. subtilis]|uniref:hypothetical protein n=1 Tax=Bacillus subtilis TaxID=1423 RepID=UPI000C756069|nr:hypothetical protein [Bacillus subtilis]PLV31801.1 hypothetical protein BSP4_43400 [Bacillus subtilis subsp. subtilis]